MTEYRRARVPGATYFFTVNCAERKGNSILTNYIDPLRKAFRKVKNDHPFKINAIVILPEHLIRDEEDYPRHVDQEIYPLDWASDIDESNNYGE